VSRRAVGLLGGKSKYITYDSSRERGKIIPEVAAFMSILGWDSAAFSIMGRLSSVERGRTFSLSAPHSFP